MFKPFAVNSLVLFLVWTLVSPVEPSSIDNSF